MANRYTTQFVNCLQKGVNAVIARVQFGASGAPTIQRNIFNSQGLVSVTRNSQGVFTFVFGTQAGMLDVYNTLLSHTVSYDTIATAAAPTAPLHYLSANAVANSASCSLQLTFTNTAGAATDPASGEIIRFVFLLKNSTAP